MAAAAAKERRGDKGDSTMSGADLAAAVKYVHLKSMKGWSSYSTVKKRVQFLEALSPAWTELVVCGALAATPVLAAAAAAAAAEPTWPGASGGSAPTPGWPHTTPPLPPAPAAAPIKYAAMTPAQRRAQMAALTAAMEADGN